MSKTLFWKALLIVQILLSGIASGQVLNVPLAVQEQNQWCWAAVSSSILQSYGPPQNQCKIAEYTRSVATWHNFGSVNCCDNPSGECNYWNYNYGYAGSIQDILTHWGVYNYGIASALQISEVETEIAANRPFIIRWAWNGGGGHFLVGYGIQDTALYYMNPFPGEGLEIGDYNWVVSDQTHTWTHTNRMETSLPKVPFIGLALSLSAGGADYAGTVNSDGPTQVGYAKVDVSSGPAPYGTAVFSLKQNGVTVGETGVPASPLTTAARIFIDYRSSVAAIPARISAGTIDIDTGIAVVNYGSASANVTYTLQNIAGATLSIGHGMIAAGAHFAKFIDQLGDVAPDFALPPNFQSATQFASLEISSDQPLSILALRMSINQRNESLYTTTPIADLTQPLTSNAVYFPQLADGGGETTSLILLNTSNVVETGTLQIFDDNGNPLVVNQVAGTSGSTFRYSIQNGGVFRFQTDGSPTDTNVGWVQLTPDAGTSTPIGAGVFSYNPGNFLVTESGIPTALSTTHARIYVDLSGGHDTGLAIANPANTNAGITIAAFQSDGVTGIGTSQGPLQLPANGHGAHFANEFVTGLPAGFTGVLDISSSTPFAALTMRSLYNERNDFLVATFPIADMTRGAPFPIVFPQIADGGGLVTQFILIGTGGASSVTLNFYGDADTPLAVGK